MTEFLTLSAYTNIMAGSQAVNEDYELNISKLHETLKLAKGYFEFQGDTKSDEMKIYRFNIDALRNNYRSTDLESVKYFV